MKKCLVVVALVGFALLGGSGSSLAALYTFSDLYDAPGDPGTSVGWFDSFTFTHNILDDPQYNPATDTLISGNIVLRFQDDGGCFDLGELATLRFDRDYVDTFEVDTGAVTYSVNMAYLRTDGLLTVKIQSVGGDFYFVNSTLNLTADRTGPPVPEPATMLLMGTGIAGLAAMRRFRKKS